MRNSSSLDWLRFMHTPNDYRVSQDTTTAMKRSLHGRGKLMIKAPEDNYPYALV